MIGSKPLLSRLIQLLSITFKSMSCARLLNSPSRLKTGPKPFKGTLKTSHLRARLNVLDFMPSFNNNINVSSHINLLKKAPRTSIQINIKDNRYKPYFKGMFRGVRV